MKKETATRFSVSLPPSLLNQLDKMTEEKGYDNRSLAIADMIRAQLVEHRQKSDTGEIAGTITLVYDHHKPHLQASLTDIQHDHHDAILSTVHVHLDHHNCLEVLIVHGKASVIRKIADELIAALDDSIAANNRNPKPFVWTATAELILDRVASLGKRTILSPHRIVAGNNAK